MKTRIVLSMVVILIVVAASLGATMAWFTAEESIENTFVAGTLMFDLSEDMTSDSLVEGLVAPNVNPGDCYEKEITIENEGTKYILLRMKLTESWVFDAVHLADYQEALGFDLTEGNENSLRDLGTEASYNEVENILGDFEEDPLIRSELESDLENAGWIYNDGNEYWYYDEAIEGTYGDNKPDPVNFEFEICFDGEKMHNEYQGSTFEVNIEVEAIQASNNASGEKWDVNSKYVDDDVETADTWEEWDPENDNLQYQ